MQNKSTKPKKPVNTKDRRTFYLEENVISTVESLAKLNKRSPSVWLGTLIDSIADGEIELPQKLREI